jgi:hypothetical protein
MNHYTLVHKRDNETAVVASTTAGTLKQAQRRLYRGKGLTEATAQAQGYRVEFNQPTAPIKAVQTLPQTKGAR